MDTLFEYLDDFESDKKESAEFDGKTYKRIIGSGYRWSEWAAPKRDDGNLDLNIAKTGNDLRDFVNNELFPYLASFRQTADNPRNLTYKIGEIFGEINNKVQSGYTLRQVINKVDELKFLSHEGGT